MKTVVINLPERIERLQNMKNQFGLFIVSNGVKHSMPHTGCALAHIQAIRKALQNGEEYCLIMEDDCILNKTITVQEFYKKIEVVANKSKDFQR